MTDSKQPEYTSTTGKFRAEHIVPFVGRKAIVTVTPSVPAGTRPTSSVAAGIVAGAHRDRTSTIPRSPTIYFHEGFSITVDVRQPDSALTITLIEES